MAEYRLKRRGMIWRTALVLGLAASILCSRYSWPNAYYQTLLVLLCINIILTLSLNLVNGYMGEFSIAHAGFMAVGAYSSAYLMARVFPESLEQAFFPLGLIIGGAAAGLSALVIALPAFRTRGDYLAIVTVAFIMIVKSAIENLEVIGGARGFTDIHVLTSLPWALVFTAATVWIIRNLIYSKFGRGVVAIREDETAALLSGVNTRQVKVLAFVISAFFAGVAGGLFAHFIPIITPRSFDIVRSTDILVMVYLGGIGSIAGSILGAVSLTVLLEALRPLEVWRMAAIPLILVLLMILRPKGIMGLRELRIFVPERYPDAKQ